MAGSNPWLAYRLSAEWCQNVLRWPGSTLYLAEAETALGFVLLHPRGFLGSPYIAALAVVENHRGNGIGSSLLNFAEKTFSGARHAFLCVSSFNNRAEQLYQRHGYSRSGELPDLIADGCSEILMCKRLL